MAAKEAEKAEEKKDGKDDKKAAPAPKNATTSP